MQLPLDPMKPIARDDLPLGDDWGYQLKWDGVRLLTRLTDGRAELFSRRLLPKNAVYPELAERLSSVPGKLLLDGEAVVFDPVRQRPVFQRVLHRERLKAPDLIRQYAEREPVRYILFDLLHDGTRDLTGLPYAERHKRLGELFPEPTELLMVTDLFYDGPALWDWVEAHGWEGVVSKRLASTYKPGKKHRDWYKKKTALLLNVTIVGFTIREGRLASLVMSDEGEYFGRVSLGLTESSKQGLLAAHAPQGLGTRPSAVAGAAPAPWPVLHPDLKGEKVVWLEHPFAIRVTGLEVTDAGLLRHPKIVSLDGADRGR